MEGVWPSSPQSEYPVDGEDSEDLTGLSTFLVAAIEDVKEKISQVEFIFCRRLFPNLKSRSKSMQKKLAEAKKSAEDEWKKKEASFLRQVEELRLEKQNAQEESRGLMASLEHEKVKLTSTQQLASRHEAEKRLLLDKVDSVERSEELVSDLREQLRLRTSEVSQGKEMQERLLQQMESKDHELLAERNKRKQSLKGWMEMNFKYKQLKSQYNFLLKRSGLTTDWKPNCDGMELETESPGLYPNKRVSQDSDKDQHTTLFSAKPNEKNIENGFQNKLEDDKGRRSHSSNADLNKNLSSTSNSLHLQNYPANVKSESPSGLKRPVSYWRDTRARQEPRTGDLHDDFLDTPMENARENKNKAPHEEVQDFAAIALRDMDFNHSDDETQEINADPIPQKSNVSIQKLGTKGFKYVEPVRKKAERENLKGIECKQCKKFYDVVLPDGGNTGNNNENNCENIRCEHHDGVSRHRYSASDQSFKEAGVEESLDSLPGDKLL